MNRCRSLLPGLLASLLLLPAGCLFSSAPKQPPPPPEPLLRIGLARLVDLRPVTAPAAGAPVTAAPLAVPEQSEEGAVARGLHKALVGELRRLGHPPSTVEPVAWMVFTDSSGERSLPALLPAVLFPQEIMTSNGVLVVGLRGWTRKHVSEGEKQEVELQLALYRTRDGQRVWSREESWSHVYEAAPDPADLTDDLIDGTIQRAVPKGEEVGPLPLLFGLNPAVAPPPPPPPPGVYVTPVPTAGAPAPAPVPVETLPAYR